MALIDNPASQALEELWNSIVGGGGGSTTNGGGGLTDAQQERIFYAGVAKAICAHSMTLDKVNEWIDAIKWAKGASVPAWLHRVDDTEFLQLQLLGECAPVGTMSGGALATQQENLVAGVVSDALAKQKRSWLVVGGAAVVGAAIVGVAVWAMKPTKAIRRRKRR